MLLTVLLIGTYTHVKYIMRYKIGQLISCSMPQKVPESGLFD